MAKRELPVEMGNLVCKFGSKNLLDYFEEIVFPAFKDGNLKRAYGQTTYFFEDVRITSIHNRAVLVGRLIKDTVLEREQVYVPDKGLIHDDEEMRSSPSSVFALILDVHRIILAKETKFAPDLKLFKLALESFLREKYAEYINVTWEESKTSETPLTKKAIQEKHLAPRLEIIPLTSAQGISEFIRQFEILSNVTYVFDDRNDESDNDAFFDAVQRQKDSVKSMRTQVVHANPEGLDKETVIEEVQAATSQGTQKVKLSGKDSEGNRRTGDNNSFQLKQKLKFLSITPEKMAKVLVDKFLELVDQGIVSVGRPTQKTLQKLSQYQGDEDEL